MKQRSHYWRLAPYIRPHFRTVGLAFVCTLVFTVFWPILAWLVGKMAGSIGAGDVRSILTLAGVAAAIFLVRGAAQYGQDSLMAQAALTIALELRQRVYRHLQTLGLSYFEGAKTGDLSYRLTEDIDRIGEVINKLFHDFIPSVLQLIVVFGYMFFVNWQLTLAVLIVAPIMGVLIGFFGEKLLRLSRRSQTRISNLSSLLTEGLGAIRLVKAFAAEEYQLKLFTEEAEQHRRAQFLAEKVKALQFVVVGFLEAMAVVFLFCLAAWQISLGNLTGVGFISFVTAVAMLIDPISHITADYNLFKQGEASIDRIFELLILQPAVRDQPGAVPLPRIQGEVTYENVGFDYGNGKLVLKQINFTARPGEMIALVGASGAGKSTLVNLLMRLYDPTEGAIFIDGQNIQGVTLQSLRTQIAIVPQDNILFSGTIAENIAFGQTELNLDAITEAAKIANAHQFVSEFAQGYQTYVGERGVTLSGGQRQRLAIARAVLRNPGILILDEATSALDSESEKLVQEALERIVQRRTVFVIAHRLATVRRASRIFVLERGEIIETGTHEQLLAQQGRYARFHSQQFETTAP
ncbi:MAG: ATP-binding cassette domain-containing protein [Cyanobacteria bacterium RI_101]|nr:ATP-binding cassette domain-containing protein [Cyanobacteria bacterium RI_101]